MIHPAKNPQPNGFDLATFAPSLDGVAGEALGTFLSDFQKGNNSMPKLPEVTVHVTTEPDPKEAHEFKASADLWAEQCRTLQRTLLDAQIELESMRVRLKHAQQGLGEGITRPHDGPEGCPTYYDGCNCTVEVLVHNIERAEKAEAGLAVAQALIKVLEIQAPGYAEIERERIIALIEDSMRTSIAIREGDTGIWLVFSDLLRDIRNPK